MTRDDALDGWRAWNLTTAADGPTLLPTGSGVGSWPHREPFRARCGVPAMLRPHRRHHVVPDPDCRCGIHAGRSLDTFARERPAWPPAPVLGRVSIWGRVIEHERGWRASRAYPSRLALACIVCAWIEPGPGTPQVVHAFAGNLSTFCDAHRGGIQVPDGRRTQPTGIDPEALLASLLEAYAVDRLPESSIAPLFSRPAAPEMAAHWPAVRVLGA